MRLTKKAEPPPTRDVNRDSGTDSAIGGWLRRLVRLPGKIVKNSIEPLIEFLANFSQMSDLLKSELLVQPNARCLIRRDVRQNGTKAGVPCRLNQRLEQLTPNPLPVKIVMDIDGVFQRACGGIGGSE
jgi:hypothetical protein